MSKEETSEKGKLLWFPKGLLPAEQISIEQRVHELGISVSELAATCSQAYDEVVDAFLPEETERRAAYDDFLGQTAEPHIWLQSRDAESITNIEVQQAVSASHIDFFTRKVSEQEYTVGKNIRINLSLDDIEKRADLLSAVTGYDDLRLQAAIRWSVYRASSELINSVLCSDIEAVEDTLITAFKPQLYMTLGFISDQRADMIRVVSGVDFKFVDEVIVSSMEMTMLKSYLDSEESALLRDASVTEGGLADRPIDAKDTLLTQLKYDCRDRAHRSGEVPLKDIIQLQPLTRDELEGVLRDAWN